MKDFLKLIKFSFALAIVIFIVERSISSRWNVAFQENVLVFAVNFLYAFVITYVNSKYTDVLNSFVSWKEAPKKRLILGVIGAVILSMLAIIALRLFVAMIIEKGDFQDFLNTDKSYYIFSLILTVNIIIAVHAYFFFKAFTTKKVEEHQIKSKTETAKFESLKNQLDPHFLFNSLNVLTSLIEENPKQAEKFTTKLSKIYRYVLQQKNQDLIEVTNELQFANNYMDLLKIRFEDAVEFNVSTNFTDDKLKIVPLSLQLLLENAVKHNVISTTKKLEINITQEQNYLVISNNINPKSNLGKSTKVGLKNIIDRYALVTNAKVYIDKTETAFTVKLPLLLKKSKIMNTSINDQEKYNRARKKVKNIKDFYSSLIAYVFLIPFLVFIWYNYTPNVVQWFWFPAIGWGIGLALHGFSTFSSGSNWESKKIKQLMANDNFDDLN